MVATKKARRSRRAFAARLGSTATVAAMGLVLVPAAASAAPPPGRAYELVSPNSPTGFSAGVDYELKPAYSVSAADGDALMFSAMGPLADDPQRAFNVPGQLGHRTATGWTVTDPFRMSDPSMPLNFVNTQPNGITPSRDMRQVVFTSGDALTPGQTGTNFFYRTELGAVDVAQPADPRWRDGLRSPHDRRSDTRPVARDVLRSSAVDGRSRRSGPDGRRRAVRVERHRAAALHTPGRTRPRKRDDRGRPERQHRRRLDAAKCRVEDGRRVFFVSTGQSSLRPLRACLTRMHCSSTCVRTADDPRLARRQQCPCGERHR